MKGHPRHIYKYIYIFLPFIHLTWFVPAPAPAIYSICIFHSLAHRQHVSLILVPFLVQFFVHFGFHFGVHFGSKIGSKTVLFWFHFWNPFFSGLEALQVPLQSLPEPLILLLRASKTRKVWFSDGKITLFENDAFWYFKVHHALIGVILVHLGPLWPQNGPQNSPQNSPKMDQK